MLPCSAVEEFCNPFLVTTNDMPMSRLEHIARISPINLPSNVIVKIWTRNVEERGKPWKKGVMPVHKECTSFIANIHYSQLHPTKSGGANIIFYGRVILRMPYFSIWDMQWIYSAHKMDFYKIGSFTILSTFLIACKNWIHSIFLFKKRNQYIRRYFLTYVLHDYGV